LKELIGYSNSILQSVIIEMNSLTNMPKKLSCSHHEIDIKTQELLAEFHPVVKLKIDDIVAEFLEYVTAWPEMRQLTNTAEGTACLRREQGQHLLNLFLCKFDEGYFARVSRMGLAHEKAGLEPRWYLGAYGHVLKILVDLAIEHCGDDAIKLLATVSAINRVVEIDMASAVSTIYSPNNKRPVKPNTVKVPVKGVDGLAKATIFSKPSSYDDP